MPALDESTIQSLFAARGIVEVENFTAPGCYSIQAESSFKVSQPKNRASVKWRNAEHVVLKDQPVDVQSILATWQQVTSADPDPVHIQKLYLFDHDSPTGPIYMQYDASGNPMATGDLSNLLMAAIPRLQSIQSPASVGSHLQPSGIFNSDAPEKLVNEFKTDLQASGLKYEDSFLQRFVAALLAKPFVILTGLSGSGKTKLAEAFAAWLGKPFEEDGSDGSRFLLVPVGADWTNNEHLLGYPDALREGAYVLPDSKVLQFLLAAKDHRDEPYFLILDEMNLSHVERYFADFLSAMESSGRTLRLHGATDGLKAGELVIPADLKLPDNLFVIGTMNVDETTYMVSPKVLDRAQTLEFRVSHNDIEGFLGAGTEVKLDDLAGKGASSAAGFRALAGKPPVFSGKADLETTLLAAFDELAKLGAEFAFRSTAEIVSFAGFAEAAGLGADETADAAILQKLLPRVHGSRRKLEKPLEALWGVCRKDGDETELRATREEFAAQFYKDHCRFPWSGEKIARMFRQAVDNGFASFAEA